VRNHCVRRAAAFSISVLTIASGTACLKHVSSLPPGPITVSGQVTDANGAALPSGNVRLIREHTYIQTTPDPSGHYAFSSLAAGSYFLLPHKPNCRFLPPAADLDHLTANTSQDFGGDGPACGGEFTVNAGAMTGPLTIGGHVHDSSGNPVLGARIDLGEHEKAVRFTDLTGSYVFHVKAEDYRLHISGACVFTPKQVKEDRTSRPDQVASPSPRRRPISIPRGRCLRFARALLCWGQRLCVCRTLPRQAMHKRS
jgi:hypothetical protein